MNAPNVHAGRLERRVRRVGRETTPEVIGFSLCLCNPFGAIRGKPLLRPTALQKTAYRRSIIRDAVVGCADEGGASSANDGLRKLSPSYGPARSGMFSSDRAIQEYANDIWKVQPVDINLLRQHRLTLKPIQVQ